MNMKDIRLNPLETPERSRRRLCDETYRLAAEYLSGAYLPRLRSCQVHLEDYGLPPEERHGKCALMLARHAPLEILPVERLAGSAPLEEASYHRIPGFTFSDGRPISSISHTTGDFANAVALGLSGLESEINAFRRDAAGQKQPFYNGLLDTIRAMRLWVGRYIKAYRDMLEVPEYKRHEKNLRSVIANLERVPENSPETFVQAVQSLWCFFEFQRLCGNWSGLGRIDQLLGPYLEQDLAAGRISLQEARECLAHFWIKGTEWCHGLRATSSRTPGSGDAQFYQNVILSGIDADGNHIENPVTFLVLDIIEELHISDYPVTVRVNKHSSDKLLRKIAEVQLLGGGIVSIYNEELILKGLANCGYGEQEARTFTNDGCWEVIIPGKTHFSYFPLDILPALQKAIAELETECSFEALYGQFLDNVRAIAQDARQRLLNYVHLQGKDPDDPGSYPTKPYGHADAVLSLIMPSCRRSGCSYSLYGTTYVVKGLHMGGLPDIANSLYAIKEMVFANQRLSLLQLRDILENDWRGEERLQQEIVNSLVYYGNDNEDADAMLQRVFNDCSAIFAAVGKVEEIRTVVGVSTFGREIEFAPHRKATAFGMNKGRYLAPNLSPTPGTDKSSISSVLNSYCRMDFTRTPNGCPLDLRLNAGIRNVEKAPELLANVLRVFCQKGGMYLQLDTTDVNILKDAQKNPDRYPNLAVRISGWSARFASLSKEWQDMIINRTALEL